MSEETWVGFRTVYDAKKMEGIDKVSLTKLLLYAIKNAHGSKKQGRKKVRVKKTELKELG